MRRIFIEQLLALPPRPFAFFDQEVPDLLALLGATRRKDAERLARSMTITWTQLAALGAQCERYGYTHDLIVLERRRAHAELNEQDRDAIFGFGGPRDPQALRKATRKLATQMQQRKLRYCHLFTRGTEWHAFFFRPQDMAPASIGVRPHYKSRHLHYSCHLFEPRLTADEVRRRAENDEDMAVADVHIDFIEDEP